MTAREGLLLASLIFGGLALFLFGMQVMTDGLRRAAGDTLRRVLSRTGRRPVLGTGLGTGLGFLVHSSAATVMLLAFVNAGLMTLPQTIPAVAGANFGTTLSMQLMALKVDQYCYLVIALGFLVRMLGGENRTGQLGLAVLGFGLIFLGMRTMGEAVHPYREQLQPFLAGSDARTWRGMFFGLGVSLLITTVIQSSGATIGMCFALAHAGVFTELANVFPIVLGAHVGTCVTALLGSIGTHIEARRVAAAHLLFNILAVTLAAALSRPLLWLLERSADDLAHQTANLHTLTALIGLLVVVPAAPVFVKLVRWFTPSREPPAEPSFLDPELIRNPEQAIQACIRELRRVARICNQGFRLDANLMVTGKGRRLRRKLLLNEQAVDETKVAMTTYLEQLTLNYLSRRQAILIQHIERCIVELERIGDHVEFLGRLSLRRMKMKEALMSAETFRALFLLYRSALDVLHRTTESLQPETKGFAKHATAVLEAREAYVALSMQTQDAFLLRLEAKQETPMAGLIHSQYVTIFDRIVRHCRNIALAEKQPQFWIKRKKLERQAVEATPSGPPVMLTAEDLLPLLDRDEREAADPT